jgi:hypothetical protein
MMTSDQVQPANQPRRDIHPARPGAARPTSASAAHAVEAFLDIVGKPAWAARMRMLSAVGELPRRAGRARLQRHAIEVTLERLRRQDIDHQPGSPGARIAAIAGEIAAMYATLSRDARARLRADVRAAVTGEATLVPIFHVARTAALQKDRGFKVGYAYYQDQAPFDLLIERDGIVAEIACDVVSAEEGRDVHRGAWVNLVDRVDPDLQTWLASHPGRYLLKLTLPQGLRHGDGRETADLAALHTRIRAMLETSQRADHDEAAVLRLDPLMLAAAQADESGLMSSLRREFGPEAHLAVTQAGGGVFVLAARAGRENEVAVAIRRRMASIAPIRLTGTRPGILAMFVEDTDQAEWHHLRDRLELEGEARQFLTQEAARRVVAVTCACRVEMFGAGGADGEMRFRNPSHPAARLPALQPAVVSTV